MTTYWVTVGDDFKLPADVRAALEPEDIGAQPAGAYTTVGDLDSALDGVVDVTTHAADIAAAKNRANHTGQQPASTISDFVAAVQAVGGGGGSVTDASALTTGILPSARIAPGSVTDDKLASGTALTPAERSKIAAAAPAANPTFTGTVSGVTKAHVGLGNVDNTSDAAKPVSAAQAQGDLASRARANHTGTQTASTISDLTEAVEDISAGLLTRGTHSGITFTYDDAGNRINATVTAGGTGSGGGDVTTAQLNAATEALSWRNIPWDGTTDAGPAIQALYDANLPIEGRPNGKYLINTPVFFDKAGDAGAYGRYEMNMNGAQIIAGPNLPRCSAFSRNANSVAQTTAGISNTRWAFFTNTKRTAWDTTTNIVTVDGTTKASSLSYSPGFGSLMPMVFRNLTFKGRAGEYDGNAGLVFGNRCSHRIENYTMLGAFTMLSWFDYGDVQILIQGQGRPERLDGTGKDAVDPSLSYHMQQEDQADNIYLEAIKGGNAAYLKRNRGAVFNTVLAGIKLVECSAVTINGHHMESQIADQVALEVFSSEVTVIGSVMYRRPSAGANVEITDSDANMGSVVSFIDCQQMTFWDGDGPTGVDMINNVWGPAVDILAATPTTRVSFRGANAKLASVKIPGVRRPSTANLLTSSGASTLTTALGTNQARALMASGNFELVKLNATWKVIPTGGQDLVGVTALPAPTVTLVSTDTATGTTAGTWLDSGTLTQGTVYTYYVAAVDAAGGVTNTQSVQVTCGSTKVVRIKVAGISNCALIVWRGTGAGATPDRYQRLTPGSLNEMHTFDVGAYIDGKTWATTSIPARPSAATTASAVLLNGVAVS